jgi:hypothetical protein
MVVTCSAVDPHYPMNPDPNRFRNKRLYRYKSGNKFDRGFCKTETRSGRLFEFDYMMSGSEKKFLGCSDPDPHFFYRGTDPDSLR